jgi:hypothetical protein
MIPLFVKWIIKDFAFRSWPTFVPLVGGFLIIYSVFFYLCYKNNISSPYSGVMVSLLVLSFSSTAAGIILVLLKWIYMVDIGSESSWYDGVMIGLYCGGMCHHLQRVLLFIYNPYDIKIYCTID